MNEVIPGITRIGFGYVNAFLVAGEWLTLVDAGLPKKAPKLERAIAEAGRSLRDVLITHHHQDHVGSLAAIASDGVTVWAHAADAGVISGVTPPPPAASRNALDRLGVRAVERVAPKASPARVDREISDGQHLEVGEGFVAYHTPGHTAGHVSFLYPSKRVLFVGDAAANMLGRLGPPFGLYSENHAEVKRSIAKIAELDFDVACFGHGRVLTSGACVRFRKLAETLAS
jgi:glyoxylase-like metal-dependent hydrolase (beta-lactamase superfamily II)